MKKLVIMFICMLATFTFVACSDNDYAPPIDPVNPERGDETSDEKIEVETVLFNSVPNDIKQALKIRCLNNVDNITPLTQVVALSSSQLDEKSNQILDIYDKGGLIVLTRPNVKDMNAWFEKVGLMNGLASDTDSLEIYAFNKKKQYILSARAENMSVNENLNPFVTWVNVVMKSNNPSLPNDKENVIEKIIEGYEVTHEFPFYHEFKETNYGDVISGKGKISARYKFYPVYVFDNQPNKGDYYLVTAEIIAENGKLCPVPDSPTHYYERQHGMKAHICGFFMTELNVTSTLKSDQRDAEVIFPVGYSPTPLTTQNSTTYSHGKTWNVGGDVSIGGSSDKKFSGAITVNANVSYSDQTSTTLSDVNIANLHNGSEAIFRYKVYNLPHYKWLTITPPPAISVSTATFYEEWIWHVPSTNDYSEETFTLYTTPSVSYGSCHFYTTGADYREYVTKPKLPNAIGTKLTSPNRIPTGKININNDTEGMYIFDIHLKNLTTNVERTFLSEESLPCGDGFVRYIPVGKYQISFMMGESRKTAKRYVLVNDEVSMERAQILNLHSSFDFETK